MKKNRIRLLLFISVIIHLLFFSKLLAQIDNVNTYQVLFLRGEVTHLSTGKKLRRASIFHQNDPLSFQDQQTRIAVIDEQARTFVVKAGENKRHHILRSLKRPNGARGKTAPSNYGELQNYFSDTVMILGDTLYVPIPVDIFPLLVHTDFYVLYNWSGTSDGPVAKFLRNDSNGIFIDKQSLYMVDGQSISPEQVSNYALYYYDAKLSKSILINYFTPLFAQDEELEAMVEILLIELKANMATELYTYQSLLALVEAYYTVLDEEDFRSWLKSRFGI